MIGLKKVHKVIAYKRTEWVPSILTGRQLHSIFVPLLPCDNVTDLYNMAPRSPCMYVPCQNRGLLLFFTHQPLQSPM